MVDWVRVWVVTYIAGRVSLCLLWDVVEHEPTHLLAAVRRMTSDMPLVSSLPNGKSRQLVTLTLKGNRKYQFMAM